MSSRPRRWPFVVGLTLLVIVIVGAVAAWRYIPLVDNVQEVRAAANRLSAQARALGPADVDQAAVDRLRRDVQALRSNLAPIGDAVNGDPLAAVARNLPGVDEQLLAAEALVSAADSLVEAGELGLVLADRVVSVRERNDADPKFPVIPELVAIMATSTDDVARMNALVASASAELERVPANAIEPLADARDLLAQPLIDYGAALDDFDRIDDVLPAILGWGGEKDYLVLAQNPAELRATGGYAGTVGRLGLLDGAIIEQRFSNANASAYRDDLPFVDAPDPLVSHLLEQPQSWRIADSNWWADFPTSARQALELNRIETGVDGLDGVVAINTFAIDRLLEVVGPITIDDGEFDLTVGPGDVTLALMAETRDFRDGDRKEVVGVLGEELIRRILSLPPDRWLALLEAVEDIGREDMMLAWFADDAAQQLAVDAGWDGAVRDDPGDYLYVVESNMAPTSKYNLVVKRSTSLQVALDENGDTFSSAKLEWRNDAGLEGEPFEALRSYSSNTEGLYAAYVRVLVPSGSDLLAANGQARDEIRGVESIDEEAGRTVFANYLAMEPGPAQLTYAWVTPGAAVETADGWEYRLTWQRQPGAMPEDVTARIDLPPGATVTDATAGAVIDGERVMFETTLVGDAELRIAYDLPPTT